MKEETHQNTIHHRSHDESHHHHSEHSGERHSHHHSSHGEHHSHHHNHHRHIKEEDPQDNIEKAPLVERLINLRIISLIAILLLIPVLFTRVGELKHAIDLYSLQSIAVRYFVCRQAIYTMAWFCIMLFFVFYFVQKDNRDTIYINVRYIKRMSLITGIFCTLKSLVSAVYIYHSREVFTWYSPNNITEVLVWGLLGTFFILYWKRRKKTRQHT